MVLPSLDSTKKGQHKPLHLFHSLVKSNDLDMSLNCSGDLAAISGSDGVCIVRARDHRVVQTLHGLEDARGCVQWSPYPKNKGLLVSSAGVRMHVWNVELSQYPLQSTINTFPKDNNNKDNSSEISDIAWNYCNSDIIAVASKQFGDVLLYDLRTMLQPHVVVKGKGADSTSCLAWHHLTNHLLLTASDNHVFLRDIRKPNECAVSWLAHHSNITNLDWNSSETDIFVTSSASDTVVKLWSMNSRECHYNLDVNTQCSKALFTPSGLGLLTESKENNAILQWAVADVFDHDHDTTTNNNDTSVFETANAVDNSRLIGTYPGGCQGFTINYNVKACNTNFTLLSYSSYSKEHSSLPLLLTRSVDDTPALYQTRNNNELMKINTITNNNNTSNMQCVIYEVDEMKSQLDCSIRLVSAAKHKSVIDCSFNNEITQYKFSTINDDEVISIRVFLPGSYPYSMPKFHVITCAAEIKESQEKLLLLNLNKITKHYTDKGQVCMMQCMLYITDFLNSIDNPPSCSGFLDSEEITSANNNQNNHINNEIALRSSPQTVFGMLSEGNTEDWNQERKIKQGEQECLPCPRLCGATWSPGGKLVYFCNTPVLSELLKENDDFQETVVSTTTKLRLIPQEKKKKTNINNDDDDEEDDEDDIWDPNEVDDRMLGKEQLLVPRTLAELQQFRETLRDRLKRTDEEGLLLHEQCVLNQHCSCNNNNNDNNIKHKHKIKQQGLLSNINIDLELLNIGSINDNINYDNDNDDEQEDQITLGCAENEIERQVETCNNEKNINSMNNNNMNDNMNNNFNKANVTSDIKSRRKTKIRDDNEMRRFLGRNTRVSVTDYSLVTGIDNKLAIEFKLQGTSVSEVCRYNEQIAINNSRPELALAWRIAQLCANEELSTMEAEIFVNNNDTDNFFCPWSENAFGGSLMKRMIQHFLTSGHFQMAVLLACVFNAPRQKGGLLEGYTSSSSHYILPKPYPEFLKEIKDEQEKVKQQQQYETSPLPLQRERRHSSFSTFLPEHLSPRLEEENTNNQNNNQNIRKNNNQKAMMHTSGSQPHLALTRKILLNKAMTKKRSLDELAISQYRSRGGSFHGPNTPSSSSTLKTVLIHKNNNAHRVMSSSSLYDLVAPDTPLAAFSSLPSSLPPAVETLPPLQNPSSNNNHTSLSSSSSSSSSFYNNNNNNENNNDLEAYDIMKLIYAEYLLSIGAYQQRAQILKCVVNAHALSCDSRFDIEEPNSLKIGLDVVCQSCGSVLDITLKSSICDKCNTQNPMSCVICDLAVKGVVQMCYNCQHGGHPTHLTDWFSKFDICPTGCGCRCANYLPETISNYT